MKKLMLIINPNAGKKKIRSQLCDLIERLTQNGFIPTVFITDPVYGAEKIVDQYSDDYDLIVCSGGDGTLNQVISRLLRKEKRPPIGYIPAGTANDVAKSLDLSNDIIKAADDIVTAVPTPFDVGTFGSSNFIYIASFGAFTEASYSAPQATKNALGHLAYVLEGIKSVQNIKSYHIRIETEDAVYEDDYVFGAMINSFSFAGMFKFNKDYVAFDDGLFEVMLIKTPRTLAQLQNAVVSLLSQKYDDQSLTVFHASKLRVTCDEPIAWTTDGEFGDVYKSVNLHVNKQAVQLLLKDGTFLGGLRDAAQEEN